MLINSGNLGLLRQQFSGAFRNGFAGAPKDYLKVATKVPSSTAENKYSWLGQFPAIREWLGDVQVKNLEQHDYAILNKDFESTVAVKVKDIEDDQYGVYDPIMQSVGEVAANHPARLVFQLLSAGFSTLCYDGQYFFDTDHVVNGANVSNTGGGSGSPWFVLDTSRALKPLIYQERKPYQFFDFSGADSEKVQMEGKALYGVRGRSNVGFGFWQMAYGSKQTLDAAAFQTALAALGKMVDENGEPLGCRGTLLVCGWDNRAAAETVLGAQFGASGASNINYKACDLLVSPWIV